MYLMYKSSFFLASLSMVNNAETFPSVPTKLMELQFININVEDVVAPLMTAMHCSCVKLENSKPKTSNLAVALPNSSNDTSAKLFDERFRDCRDSDKVAAEMMLVSCSVVKMCGNE